MLPTTREALTTENEEKNAHWPKCRAAQSIGAWTNCQDADSPGFVRLAVVHERASQTAPIARTGP